MFRSLHMKLVLIMLLLITSLMAVVGAFLMTSVTNFYIDDFYSQMGETFGESNADFVNSLRAEAAQEGGVAVMQSMLETYSGTLGIDSRSRNYYILDAASGECLAASDELGGEKLEQTANLLTARNGQATRATSRPATWTLPSPSPAATTAISSTSATTAARSPASTASCSSSFCRRCSWVF